MAVPPPNGELEALLDYLYERRNFDFRGYNRASLTRRIFKRMQMIKVDDYQRYMEILEANPGEFAELFNTILINVTGLMRDKDAWDVMANRIIPAIVDTRGPEEPVCIWSAGCASGEEAYSLAVLFADAMGEDRFRRLVKIYATDADNDALAAARRGRYREADLLPAFGAEFTNRFFENDGDYGVFRGDLRRALIFGRHDLVQDPPISRIDLVACRNTLMYFTADVQGKILANFHFALNAGGYLFLGKSEALVSRTQMFQVVDLRQHIMRKDGSSQQAVQLAAAQQARQVKAARTSNASKPIEGAFEFGTVGQVVLDANGTIMLANRAARRTLAIGSTELGRHLREAEFSFRPADLRGPVERVLRERRAVTISDVMWTNAAAGDEPMTLDIVISPLESQGGVLISLLDVSRYQHLRQDLERSQRELETAYEELQSTVEELETTNEELLSTNEELETMNEELQSINEELETINNELRERSSEVSELNQFLESILGSLQSAVIVLGTQMEVKAWNRQAEELWGLRSDEVIGHHFLNLDIGFPADALRTPVRDCLAGRAKRAQVVRDAVNRRGRAIETTVSISALAGDDTTRGVILVMEAVPKDGAQAVSQPFEVVRSGNPARGKSSGDGAESDAPAG